MTLTNRRRFRYWGTVQWLALLLMLGCAGERAKRGETPISWDSSNMREIEAEWTSLRNVYAGARDKGETLSYARERLLNDRLSERDLRHLAATLDALPLHVEHTSFKGNVLAVIITSLVDSGDRDSLVKLLSIRCPSRVGEGEPIEDFLCRQGNMPKASIFACWEARLKDPILVLGEAYARCQTPETRHYLAAAVRRGFADLPVQGKDDADYVKNAMRWYEREKDRLAYNSYYAGNELGGYFSVERYEQSPDLYGNPRGWPRQPLFVTKAAPWFPCSVRLFFASAVVLCVALGASLWWLRRRGDAKKRGMKRS
jgi:hypothetical protein